MESETETPTTLVLGTEVRKIALHPAPAATRPGTDVLTVVAHIIMYNPDSHTYLVRAAHAYLHDDYVEDDSIHMQYLCSYNFTAKSYANAQRMMASPDYTLPRA